MKGVRVWLGLNLHRRSLFFVKSIATYPADQRPACTKKESFTISWDMKVTIVVGSLISVSRHAG